MWDLGIESAVRHFVYTQPKHFSNALPATLGGTKHVLSAHVGPACVWVFGLTYVCFKHLRVCDDRVCVCSRMYALSICVFVMIVFVCVCGHCMFVNTVCVYLCV